MSTPVLSLSDVSLISRGQYILDHINLELEEGSFVGLIGPNGAGKTVLLKVILGLIRPTSGTVTVCGMSPRAARGKIGYVPQYARFESDFPITVSDVVQMGRLRRDRLGARFNEDDRRAAEEALLRVDLAGFGHRNIAKLSGGQLQRVLIARALASEPKLLLLDEPTASLDTKVGRTVFELLAELAPSMSIVLVSHDIGVIATHVKTIACLNRRMHYHHSKHISGELLSEVYGCPVELIAHGHAHRVLPAHDYYDDHGHSEEV